MVSTKAMISVQCIFLFPALLRRRRLSNGPSHCFTPAAQKTLERAVALLHSFWYDEAEKTFSEATRIDPGCAMGYWGIAMSLYHPVWVPPTPADLKNGMAAVEKARSAAAKTQRERDYIAAIEAF